MGGLCSLPVGLAKRSSIDVQVDRDVSSRGCTRDLALWVLPRCRPVGALAVSSRDCSRGTLQQRWGIIAFTNIFDRQGWPATEALGMISTSDPHRVCANSKK